MRKRLFLLVAILAAVSFASFANGTSEKGAAQAAKPIVLRISNGVNNVHPSYLAGKKFGELLNQMLPGKFDVQVYANAELGDDVRATEAVRTGTLEMVTTSASPLTGLVPAFSVFDLPFIITNAKEADAIYDGPVGAKLAKMLEPKGLKLLAYYENGWRDLTNSARPVTEPADVKGMKVRTMENPIHLDLWRAMGANPVPMPFSEVFTAMQQKTIDGQENPIPTIYLQKFYEVQKYVTLTNHVYGPHILLMNQKLFDSFTPEEQSAVLKAAHESAVYQRELNRKLAADNVAELRKAGMVVTELTPAQIADFQAAVKPVFEKWAPKIGSDLVAEFQAAVAAADK